MFNRNWSRFIPQRLSSLFKQIKTMFSIVYQFCDGRKKIVHSDGTQEWHKDGRLHREDGPAYIGADGHKEWRLNGQLHRVGGPAIICPDGYQAWFQNGNRHREDGPARIWASGTQEWWLSGMRIGVICPDDQEPRQSNDKTNHITCSKKTQKSQIDIVKDDKSDLSKSNSIDGEIVWKKDGVLHRTDGPALIHPDGSQEWFYDGKKHRLDGPAVIRSDGYQEWCQNGKTHRTDGPAVILSDETQQWLQNGKLHRLDGPAVIGPDGYQVWYQNGKLHRKDGPAVIRSDGSKFWFQNGEKVKESDLPTPASIETKLPNGQIVWKNEHDQLHRTDGPAKIWPDGRQEWWQNGQCHRTDGPAIISPNGEEQWWIDNKKVSLKDFVSKTAMPKLS